VIIDIGKQFRWVSCLYKNHKLGRKFDVHAGCNMGLTFLQRQAHCITESREGEMLFQGVGKSRKTEKTIDNSLDNGTIVL